MENRVNGAVVVRRPIKAAVEDRRIAGLGEQYVRARRWGHLREEITFERFIVMIEAGSDPYIA